LLAIAAALAFSFVVSGFSPTHATVRLKADTTYGDGGATVRLKADTTHERHRADRVGALRDVPSRGAGRSVPADHV
jgi:hypothetical protein